MSLNRTSQFNFRHLILGITALTIMLLTLLVAFISAQVAFNEMSNTLYQQSVHFTQNLSKDSVAPLLYDSANGADDILKTLVSLKQVTDAKINQK